MMPPIEDGVFYGPAGERMDTRPPIDRRRLAALAPFREEPRP